MKRAALVARGQNRGRTVSEGHFVTCLRKVWPPLSSRRPCVVAESIRPASTTSRWGSRMPIRRHRASEGGRRSRQGCPISVARLPDGSPMWNGSCRPSLPRGHDGPDGCGPTWFSRVRVESMSGIEHYTTGARGGAPDPVGCNCSTRLDRGRERSQPEWRFGRISGMIETAENVATPLRGSRGKSRTPSPSTVTRKATLARESGTLPMPKSSPSN